MKSLSSCSTLLSALLLSATPALAIWPAPAKISTGDKTLWLGEDVKVSYNGQQVRYVATDLCDSMHT